MIGRQRESLFQDIKAIRWQPLMAKIFSVPHIQIQLFENLEYI